jgi:pyrimidine-nucleoside phosphorylase
LELKEALDTLHGTGPEDFYEHCLHVSAHMLVLGGKAKTLETGREMAGRSISDGTAYMKLKTLVDSQGGDVAYLDEPERLAQAQLVEEVPAPRSGHLEHVRARVVGETAVILGAGRAQKGDPIDHAVGVLIHHKVGDRLEKGEPLFTIHANDQDSLSQAGGAILEAHQWSDEPVQPLPLFYT